MNHHTPFQGSPTAQSPWVVLAVGLGYAAAGGAVRRDTARGTELETVLMATHGFEGIRRRIKLEPESEQGYLDGWRSDTLSQPIRPLPYLATPSLCTVLESEGALDCWMLGTCLPKCAHTHQHVNTAMPDRLHCIAAPGAATQLEANPEQKEAYLQQCAALPDPSFHQVNTTAVTNPPASELSDLRLHLFGLDLQPTTQQHPLRQHSLLMTRLKKNGHAAAAPRLLIDSCAACTGVLPVHRQVFALPAPVGSLGMQAHDKKKSSCAPGHSTALE
eukprot:gene4877-5026_t